MTRKRALMLMQQQIQHSATTESSPSPTHPDMGHNVPIYGNVGVHNLPLTSMPTPGASDAERDSPPSKRTRVDVQGEIIWIDGIVDELQETVFEERAQVSEKEKSRQRGNFCQKIGWEKERNGFWIRWEIKKESLDLPKSLSAPNHWPRD
ncbi:14752_t:CDS:2 [Acaulospora colombiana]|uniref:14752_t:CDS:1 n=1 Tax=Acaulospora colombiana TaxID=27376 RepID=A0ACA9MB15_9GLOM|nr:14752_t:CDS:2 [Acaulospora colombiana]